MTNREEKRLQRRVTPNWEVSLTLENGDSIVSSAVIDISIASFRLGVEAALVDLGNIVRFCISGRPPDVIRGGSVSGRATAVMVREDGTVFEFEEFEAFDFDVLCANLLRIIDELFPA